MDGASVTVRRVSADDQARWRDQRKARMMGYGALGDQGNLLERSYTYIPIPEWLLDCCTACVEVSRSADLPPDVLGDHELFKAGFAATDASQLDSASTAAVDLLRLVVAPIPLQVPVTELLLLATHGHHGQNHHAWSTPGFLWRHGRERWELSEAQAATMAGWWRSLIAGPNAEALRWPLRRFGVAKQRPFAEDRLVDLAIAVEAIFIDEDDPQRNTSALIAARANRVLDGDRTARKLRTNRVLTAYGTRSDIVHGRLPPEDDVERAASNMESVLQEALRSLLTAMTHVDLIGPGPLNQKRQE